MKLSTSFVLAIPIVVLSLNALPSFAKQTWLRCSNPLTAEGQHYNPKYPSYIINLDYEKERFELTEETGEILQGKANFFKSIIQLQYSYKLVGSFRQEKTWDINRANLNFALSVNLVGGLGAPTIYNGTCKVIPAPSSKQNLI